MSLKLTNKDIKSLTNIKKDKALEILTNYGLLKDFNSLELENKDISNSKKLLNFSSSFNSIKKEDLAIINQAFKDLIYPSISYTLPFNYRDYPIIDSFIDQGLIYSNNNPKSPQIINQAGIQFATTSLYLMPNNIHYSKKGILEYFKIHNTRELLKHEPIKVINQFFKTKKDEDFIYNNLTLSKDYILDFLKTNNVIGAIKEKVNLFSINQIYSNNEYNNLMKNKESNLNELVKDFLTKDKIFFLVNASSKELVEFIRKDKLLNLLYSMKTDNYEGYHIYEHTSSVLDIFTTYYKDKYSYELVSLIKLAILGHDIGKGVLNRFDNKKIIDSLKSDYNIDINKDYDKITSQWQMSANKYFIKYFYKSLNINEKYQPLLNYIMFDSQKITNRYFFTSFNHDKNIIDVELANSAIKAYMQAFNRKPSKHEIELLKQIAIDLQQSDGASYSLYSKVRIGDMEHYFKGNNRTFTNSFSIDSHNNIYLTDNYCHDLLSKESHPRKI